MYSQSRFHSGQLQQHYDPPMQIKSTIEYQLNNILATVENLPDQPGELKR